MKEKIARFMQGRYGVDQFGKFTLAATLVLIVVSMFMRNGNVAAVLNTLSLACLVYTYYRILSRNISKRYAENQKYLSVTSGIRGKLNREKNLMQQRKTHHIYTCPGCGQKIRIPKGKGKIEISCPKCHTKFVKKS